MKDLPRPFSIAASTRFSSAGMAVLGASKTTLPLPSTVFTSVKPAHSNAFLSSVILQLVGMTPRRKAAYLIGLDSRLRGNDTEFAPHLRERRHRPLDVLRLVRRGHLRAEARLALGHDREREAHHVDALL